MLILLGNHQSHRDIKFLDVAKEHGVVTSFPPLKVQPLERSDYGTFKKFVKSASEAWIRSNHGQL